MAHENHSEQWAVYRPVQYLGSKLRSLAPIMETVSNLDGSGRVWDAFSGSSVVAQGIASMGRSVVATDTQAFASVLAAATLAVGSSEHPPDELLAKALSHSSPSIDAWRPWAEREAVLLRVGDYDGLIGLYAELPLAWRSPDRADAIFGRTPITSNYAGTYFSVSQALVLDRVSDWLRTEFGPAWPSGDWPADTLMAALCAAASESVHSAGKHFAQPMKPARPGASNYDFTRRRALSDRRKSVVDLTSAAVAAIVDVASTRRAGHMAIVKDVLDVGSADLRRWDVSVAYLDPPYTAQQYSRFYHVLETLTVGLGQPLPLRDGVPTTGLYPDGRYLSPFCSRTRASGAFASMLDAIAEAGVAVVLSYSSGNTTGNDRSIELDELVRLIHGRFGSAKTHVLALDHTYRQFNALANAVPGRETPELLIVGQAP